ncbi:MAG TPA: SDR family oxidoreductase [Devosia sp.]|nr:SDR family oxidoreductase [Devosia sp.]
MSMDVLFVGGTGQISLPCVARAVAAGHNVAVFNRGKADAELPGEVETIVGDMKDAASYGQLGRRHFDVVCQFMAFTPEQMAADIKLFAGHTRQYIFISSASVYEKPPRDYVITEKTPTVNPFWKYSQDKIACEALLKAETSLPWTIVRPSHTVRTGLPAMWGPGDETVQRMLDGKPVIVAGDGSAPWTLTRSADFAVPFVGLFGKAAALGTDFHITADKGHTWDDIYKAIGRAFGVEVRIVHVPTDTLLRYNADWAGPLAGDKSHTALFDNSKVKAVAGDFSCATDLDTILAEPVKFVKARLAQGPRRSPLDGLIDRIAAEQSALGA